MDMDIDINKVLLVGNLEEIDELRTFPSGSTLCPFTVVTVERFRRRDGDWAERKTWHKVSAWGELGKRVHAEFSRGMRIVVEGRLSRRSYERDGETRWITDIQASSCNALGYQQQQQQPQSSYSGGGQRSENRQSYQPRHQRAQQAPSTRTQAAPPPPSEPPPVPDGEDDLPF